MLLAAIVIVFLSDARDCVGDEPATDSTPGVFQVDSGLMPSERSVILLLDRTRELLEEARYSEAVKCLDRILSGSEDFFFKPHADSIVRRSIKTEARRLLGEIPPSGRRSYELQFGPLARSMLGDAVEGGDMAEVAEVARRFFHTEAGYEATFLLGLHHMDHGRPLVAALTLRRLRDEAPNSSSIRFEPSLSLAMSRSWLAAGRPELAREALDVLREDYRDRAVTIEGREVPLFGASDDSVGWLVASMGTDSAAAPLEPTDWTIHGGSPDRNAVRPGSRPLLSPDWFVPTTDHPAVESMIHRLQRQQEDREKYLLPTLHPLVVDGVVLMRTATNLLAVDFRTGKRLWEVPADDPFEAALNLAPDDHVHQQPNLEAGLQSRLWGDGVFGNLASNGQFVFAVEDLQLPLPAAYARGLLVPGNVRSSSTALLTSNRLAAFDIRSQGKLRWEVGGSYADELPLAGAYFLGPPLPLLGDLYVLAEIDGELRLLALNADNGELLWQQQLAVVDQTVYQDSLRRVSGVSPSYADGVLVCPTSNHSIVAIELTTRSLLWCYGYAETEDSDQRPQNRLAAFRHHLASPEDRWTDSSLVLAEGYVLASPTDSERLHCLSLHDGELVWQKPREDKLFVAAVHEGKAVVATRRGLVAFRLEDGKSAWATQAPCPSNSEPSGRGFNDGEFYHLPLTGGKLMTVHLATGRVEQVVRSRHGGTLGNLVCHEGMVISQRADGIELYHQLEALRREVDRRLADQPNDARALALRGEILWDDGDLDAAVDCLRKSFGIEDSLRTHSLFRAAMLNGLEKDFARYQTYHDEIELLLESADDWATFHRLMATGWEASTDHKRALAEYRHLVDLDLRYQAESGSELDTQVNEHHSVRQHRWIRSRLLDLAESIPAGGRAELLRWIEETFEDEIAEQGPESIGLVLRYFDGLPGTRKYKEKWIERLADAGRLTEAELLLLEGVRSPLDMMKSTSIDRLATLLIDANRPKDAASLLSSVETRWADVPFDGDTSARQWAIEFSDRHESVREARVPVRWPLGLVKASVEETDPGSAVLSYSRNAIPFQGPKGLFARDLVIEHHRHQDQQIVAKDAYGQIQWRFPLSTIAERERFPVTHVLTSVDACGHLLILSMGTQVIALDTLATGDDGAPTIAWHESLDQLDLSLLGQRAFPLQIRNAQGWFGGTQFGYGTGFAASSTVVLGESLVCLKHARSCVALEPATGRTLWKRDGISAQSAIFGDDQYVLIASPQSTEATVLDANDGAELQHCTIPPADQRLMTIGRKILCWEPHGEDPSKQEFHLKLVDPLALGENRVIWGPHVFEGQSRPRPQMIDEESLAVFTANGMFQLIRLNDGERLVDTKIDGEKPISDVVVFPRESHYIVVANDNVNRHDPKRHVSPVTGVKSRRIGTARVLCFDSEGKSVWENPVIVEDHCLPLVQPEKVPCLTFACMVRGTIPGQSRQGGAEVLCLDTRSGAVVAQERFGHASHTLEIVGAPDESLLEIRMQQETLSLLFTDEPIPEGGAVGRAVRPQNSPLEAIWRAVTEGTGARESTYRSRNSPSDAAKPSRDLPSSDPTEKASGTLGNEAEAAVPADRKVAPPPPLEPAVRGRIEPE